MRFYEVAANPALVFRAADVCAADVSAAAAEATARVGASSAVTAVIWPSDAENSTTSSIMPASNDSISTCTVSTGSDSEARWSPSIDAPMNEDEVFRQMLFKVFAASSDE
jgi:hypothetical protein